MSNSSEATFRQLYECTRRRLHSFEPSRGPRRHQADPGSAPDTLGESSENGNLTGNAGGILRAPASTSNVNRNGDPSAVSENACRAELGGSSSNPPNSLARSGSTSDSQRIEFLMYFGDFAGRVWNYLQIVAQLAGTRLPKSVVSVSTRLQEEGRPESNTRECMETIDLAVTYLRNRGIDIDFPLAKLAIDTYADRNLRFHSRAGLLEQSGDLEGRNRFLDEIRSNPLDYINGDEVDNIPQWLRIVDIFKAGRPTLASLGDNTTPGVPTPSVQAPQDLPDPKLIEGIHLSRFENREFANPANGVLRKKRARDSDTYSDPGRLSPVERPAKRTRIARPRPGVVQPPAPLSDHDRSMVDYFNTLGDLRRINLERYSQYMRRSMTTASRTLRNVRQEQSGQH